MKSSHLSLAGEKSIEDSRVTFQQPVLREMPQALQRVAVLVTPEYEGIFRNGGIGTYYKTLSERLVAEEFHVILLLCNTQEGVDRNLRLPSVKQVFLTQNCHSVLSLHNTQSAILSQFQDWEWIDYENYCALFFVQAIANTFPDAYIYVEFPEMLGLGYRTVQAKRSGLLGKNCVIAVTLHSSQEWLQEAQTRYTQSAPEWFWQTSHYEQYSFEQADLAFFLSHFLKNKMAQYGWKMRHAEHLPYCFPVIERSSELFVRRRDLPQIEESRIPLVFFGRLEERKGLLTFLEVLKVLDQEYIEKIYVLFLGKSARLQTNGLGGVESQAYIQEFLGDDYHYSIVTDLFSREAIQFVDGLNFPIVCLVSPQENFPNTALEMGQLPISLVVSNTGGFQETLDLIGRVQGVYWFIPENVRSLVQAITQAIVNHPEKLEVPTRESLDLVNQRLLNQRWQSMKQQALGGFLQAEEGSSENESRRWILGMLSMEEQLYLERYAQNQYLGQGEIVELGCWLGSSTISLAMGLEKNTSVLDREKRIHTYDLFVWSLGMEQSLLDTSLKGKYKDGDSFLDEYLERITPWKKFVEVYPGDLTEVSWRKGKIECLFIDAMKSWKLANSIVKNFFPHLMPGVSLVIHQDFAHYYTVWIHLLMYRLREYLVPIEHPFIYSSRVFRFVKPVPDDILQNAYAFDSFTESEVEASFAYSLDITPEKMRPNILAAKVMYFVHTRNSERAKVEFKQVIENLDHTKWLELSNVQEAAKTHYSIDLLA